MSYIPGNFSMPFTGSVGRGRGIPMVLHFDSPVQGGDVHVVGNRPDTAKAPSVSGDRVLLQSLDLSRVQLVPHRKVKEPPTFKGEKVQYVVF